MALVDRPTTTPDASGWSESPDQAPVEVPQDTSAAPQTGTNGPDATGATIEATEATEPPRRPDGRFEKNGFRRRAASQEASADDVPRIKELTRRLRETERERDTLRGTPPSAPVANGAASPHQEGAVAPPVAIQPRPQREPVPPPPEFNLREPEFEDFKDSADPLRDYTKAMAKFTHQEERHAQAVRWWHQHNQKVAGQSEAELRSMTQAHWTRMQAAASDPAHAALVAKFKDDARPITPAVLQAIVRSGDQSAALTLKMLSTPGLLDELTLATYDKPATPDLVALVQRRLQSLGLSAATTGSVTAPSVKPAPRPPNPVRTAPDAPPRDLPGDDSSLADHAAAFHQPRRSRLRRD